MNHLLSGNFSPLFVTWLCSASLTALLKRIGVFVLLKFFVPLLVIYNENLLAPFSLIFLPYSQLNVDIPGGLKTAIYAVFHYLTMMDLWPY